MKYIVPKILELFWWMILIIYIAFEKTISLIVTVWVVVMSFLWHMKYVERDTPFHIRKMFNIFYTGDEDKWITYREAFFFYKEEKETRFSNTFDHWSSSSDIFNDEVFDLHKFIREKPKDWKKTVPLFPTFEDFNEAFETICGSKYNDCINVSYSTVFGAHALSIKTEGKHMTYGGILEHTTEPDLESIDDLYYEGGCTWGTDNNGIRYHKIDDNTGYPVNHHSAVAQEIIYRYLKNNNNELPKIEK